jgi:hypothetical protein
VDSGLTFLWSARSCPACLLAWLILVLVAPAPAVLSAGVGCPSESGDEDSAPEDASPAENETPQDENIPPESVLKRTRVLGRADASSAIMQSPQARHPSPRLRGGRPGSVHFLADGRSLRLWLRSLTC